MAKYAAGFRNSSEHFTYVKWTAATKELLSKMDPDSKTPAELESFERFRTAVLTEMKTWPGYSMTLELQDDLGDIFQSILDLVKIIHLHPAAYWLTFKPVFNHPRALYHFDDKDSEDVMTVDYGDPRRPIALSGCFFPALIKYSNEEGQQVYIFIRLWPALHHILMSQIQ
ncbi:hypothetical protein C1H76_6178 [Elsinoe australis]|uniref:Uncharacterized protein n=1 Tax=Elsinoe australis TaxID=40998 RepID=A0A4V6DTR4_9PEZI|nr:hypothetical protein C1H76_6178 [Elsinoe australis]